MVQNYQTEAPGLTLSTAMQEAARCLLCEDAPCSKACPAHTDPARFIRSLRFRNVKGAAEVIRENNALGAVCARVCPTERYCELACPRGQIDQPIRIGDLQRYITDMETKLGMEILKPGKDTGKRVAIIGAGPAGLQAATTLRQQGIGVTIFEAQAKAGGYLTYGIPEYRLPQVIIDHEVDRIVKLGVDLRCGVRVGQDVSWDHLKATYDAILVTVGCQAAKELQQLANNVCTESAISFLARVKSGQLTAADLPSEVLVIGGGDVAMDVATTLKRLGVPHVTDVAYEEFSEFRASKTELAGTRQTGVTLIDGYKPVAAHQNRVTFRHRKMAAELTITADKIIYAVGQKMDLTGLVVDLQHNERILGAAKYHTADPRVFAAGDIVPGDQTVVFAVQKGKEAATEICRTLLGGNKND